MTLARRIASELAQPAWPSTRLSQTGRCGATASSTAAVGNALPGQRLWSQFRPVIHESPGVGLDPRLHPSRDLLQRRHAAQVELFLTGSERFHVTVSIDQTRHRERIGPLDIRGSTALEIA